MSRIADIVVALIIFLPLILFVSILAVITIIVNQFSPFFTCRRLGKEGKPFTCLKLQCLTPPESERDLVDIERSTERMTRLGRIYRNHGWDELPQVINILFGQMSFVGPRPSSESGLERFKNKYPDKAKVIKEWLSERWKVLPGLSGWHQIHLSDRNIIKYDLEYLADPSLSKKLKIFVISIAILIVGKSAFFGQKIPDMYEYEIC